MNKTSTRFFLARHGETEWNQVRRLQGQLDSPLTIAGHQQAADLAQRMRLNEIQLVVTSPLARALNTAKVCQHSIGCELLVVEDLKERHFGEWQGTFFEQLGDQQRFHSIFFDTTHDAPPAGESGIASAMRLESSLKQVASDSDAENILVVTHGDIIRCFMSLLSQNVALDAYSQYGNGRFFPVIFDHKQKSFESAEPSNITVIE